jgi:hypothetical protein
MKAIVPVSLPDLLDAFEWVSASTILENLAYVSRSTGKTYITSREMDVGDELPDDIDDGREYLAVPHKNELNLGSHLAISFAENWLPESADVVHAFFRQRGAYSRFKDLLERKGCLDAWYQYETQAVEEALREWCRANDIAVVK